jgi:hypothetical protein
MKLMTRKEFINQSLTRPGELTLNTWSTDSPFATEVPRRQPAARDPRMTPKAGPLDLSSIVSAYFHSSKNTEIVFQNWKMRAQTQCARYEVQDLVWSKF